MREGASTLACFAALRASWPTQHSSANARLTRPLQVQFVATFSGLTVQDFTQPDSPVAQRYVSDLTAATSLTTGVPEGEQDWGARALLRRPAPVSHWALAERCGL